jgi:hypothetical protein
LSAEKVLAADTLVILRLGEKEKKTSSFPASAVFASLLQSSHKQPTANSQQPTFFRLTMSVPPIYHGPLC